jgi:hypothetical protein
MATTPAASKLACDILRDQLGDLSEVAARTAAPPLQPGQQRLTQHPLAPHQRVGHSLIYDGRQSLAEIVRTTVRLCFRCRPAPPRVGTDRARWLVQGLPAAHVKVGPPALLRTSVPA